MKRKVIPSAKPRPVRPYSVHLITSPPGQAELAKHGLTIRDLARAIGNFQRIEGIRVGTLIGVNGDGFFGSAREGWQPDQPGAFTEPVLNIPWWQLKALLSATSDPETGTLTYDDTAIIH